MSGAYFPPGEFPPGYFPPGYFPGDLPEAGGVTPATARSLAEAIEARFLAADRPPGGITQLYESEAGEGVVWPYAIFTIRSAPTYYHSSTSYWRDARVRFKAYALAQDEADRHRDWIDSVMRVGDFTWTTGFSIPFFEADYGEGKEPGFGRGTRRVFAAWVEYSARSKKGT